MKEIATSHKKIFGSENGVLYCFTFINIKSQETFYENLKID